MQDRLKPKKKRKFKINTNILTNIVSSQKRQNHRMDEIEEKRATAELRKLVGGNARAKLMTNVLNSEKLEDLRDTKMEKVGSEYVRVKKKPPPPVNFNKFERNEDGTLNPE